jgi:pyridoxal 5'-phosphate synthase pdxS subunit
MDVTNVEEALLAEKAGACAVMALERVPADIRREGLKTCHWVGFDDV